ncbi:uncharacterized protein EV154DRAFT_46073 [Mucor mucedo]|uniref:uncharacterized protein n=1 Tax=Mucor mucedo TaxID=29922 RepID=UPI00221FAD2B|nr:uncharacterized protein EV154DRAFT_46073 [Mucor mucedo]KAI7880264.1 hypothetical protein EV154DRAFT_46073 [Mucor mucedo]
MQPKLSFFEDRKGKKRVLLDEEDEEEEISLPKAKKFASEKVKIDDDLDDFDLEYTKNPKSEDYRTKYKDDYKDTSKEDYKIKYKEDYKDIDKEDYKIKYKDDYKETQKIHDIMDFEEDDSIILNDDYKVKYKDDYKIEEKKDYKSKFKDDYKDSLFSDDDDDLDIHTSSYFKELKKPPTPKKASFGSIQANLASFRSKKKPAPAADIFSFPSDKNEDVLPVSSIPSPQKQRRPLQNHHHQTKLFDLGSVKERQDDFRKVFMTAWLTKYRDQIMVYDSKDYAYFSLYMTIKLPVLCDEWAEFKEFKSISIENLGTGVSLPKPQAPLIISFNMEPGTFPSSKLKIKLISVMNTTSPGSSDPETESFEFQVNQKGNMEETMKAIMRIIKGKIPKFHLQMARE